LDIADSRARLEQYAGLGLVGGATGELVGRVTAGESAEITGAVEDVDEKFADAVDTASEGAAFDSGTD
ncbi:MAG: argininosuccinate synthase, partial [Microbacterium sp.]